MANSQQQGTPQGPIGEAGATARTLVAALGASPLILALVVIELATIALLYWSIVSGERERTESLKLLYQNRELVAKLLIECDHIVKPPH